MMIGPKRRRRAPTSGSFAAGPDARRHVFTPEQRSRGGSTTWSRYMRQWRGEMFGRRAQ
jgi:hypothetical protein